MKITSILILLVFIIDLSFAQGKLNRAKDDLNGSFSKSPSYAESSGDNDDNGVSKVFESILVDLCSLVPMAHS